MGHEKWRPSNLGYRCRRHKINQHPHLEVGIVHIILQLWSLVMDTPYDFGDNGLPLPLFSQLPLTPLVPLPSSYGSYGAGEYPPLAPDPTLDRPAPIVRETPRARYRQRASRARQVISTPAPNFCAKDPAVLTLLVYYERPATRVGDERPSAMKASQHVDTARTTMSNVSTPRARRRLLRKPLLPV